MKLSNLTTSFSEKDFKLITVDDHVNVSLRT